MLRILLAALLPFLAGGCADEPAYDYGDFLVEFVTYEGSDDGAARFSFQSRDDLPLQTLRADIPVSDDYEVGQRCLLRYTLLSVMPDATKHIRIDLLQPIVDDVVRQAPHDDMDKFPDTGISVTSLWRSGCYINLNGWLPYTGKNFQLLLVADESTLDDDIVVARLVYNMMGETPTFDRRVYASFDVRNIWLRPSCTTLRILVGDTAYDFKKQ